MPLDFKTVTCIIGVKRRNNYPFRLKAHSLEPKAETDYLKFLLYDVGLDKGDSEKKKF